MLRKHKQHTVAKGMQALKHRVSMAVKHHAKERGTLCFDPEWGIVCTFRPVPKLQRELLVQWKVDLACQLPAPFIPRPFIKLQADIDLAQNACLTAARAHFTQLSQEDLRHSQRFASPVPLSDTGEGIQTGSKASPKRQPCTLRALSRHAACGRRAGGCCASWPPKASSRHHLQRP